MKSLERAQRALRAIMTRNLPGTRPESEFSLTALSVYMTPAALGSQRPLGDLARYLACEGLDGLRRPIDIEAVPPGPTLVGLAPTYQAEARAGRASEGRAGLNWERV